MKILAIIVAGVAAVMFVGYVVRKKFGGESERFISRTWEGPSSDWRNSSDNH
jgi:hypothetical protein